MSLRLAIKRSLEGSEPEPATQPSISISDMKKERPIRITIRRRPRPPIVELPQIVKCINNSDPSKIDQFGFVEVSRALPEPLIEQIYQEAVDKVTRHESSKRRRQPSEEVEEISNALQVDVSDDLLQEVKTTIDRCDMAKKTMSAVFGKRGPADGDVESSYNGFVLETPKVLITKPGSNPQLPHADDHCSSCVICLIHLRDNQEPTRVAKYEGARKDYPTGITVGCDNCNRKEQLPDSDFRRGVHLTDENWHCECCSPHIPYDFEGKLTKSFGELLEENAPNLCDSYAGKKTTMAGDGMFGIPMLIHRGPGNPTTAKNSRFVLFFTLRPLYRNMREIGVDNIHHKYNPALQIHASCILYNQFKKVNSIYESSGCNLEGCFSAIVGAETASLMKEVKELKEENKKLREKLEES